MTMKIINGDNFIIAAPQNKSGATAPVETVKKFELAQPVKVDISKEAMDKYRESIKERNQDTYDDVIARHEQLSKMKQPQEDLNFALGNRLSTFQSDKDHHYTIEDKSQDLLKTYATMYDEIVTGYENGSRERYVFDDTTESGVRKLTKEEELAGLDSAYKGYADLLESYAKQQAEVAPIFEKYKKQLDQIGSARAEMANEMAKRLEETKSKKLPENISEKVVNASKLFVEQYTNPLNAGKGIAEILKNINIFNQSVATNQ